MVVLLPVLASALVAYLAVALAVHHWPRHDPAAPQLSAALIGREVRRHPRMARLLRRRIDPGLATGLALTAAAGGLIVVALLLVMVRSQAGIARYDLGASDWAARQASEGGAAALNWITRLGGTETVIALAAILVAVEHRRIASRPAVAFLVLTLAGQSGLSNGIKWLVGRARPALVQLSDHSGSSFPSGHATTAAAAFAVFALLLGRGRSRPVRAALAGGAAGVATAVAATRVLLGVHWLTDVLAGLALGWGWFALSSIAFGGRRLHFGDAAGRAATEARGGGSSDDPGASRRRRPARLER